MTILISEVLVQYCVYNVHNWIVIVSASASIVDVHVLHNNCIGNGHHYFLSGLTIYRHDNTAVATFLLHVAQCDPNCVTHDGQTPLDLIYDPELIRLLLSSGAKFTLCFPSHLRDNPTDMAIKMFILGNPGAGKSTFVKALNTEAQGFSRIKHQFTKVRDVDEKTAGIIPHDIHSKALGRLTLYDFAGHKEYYAGHDALLHNAMTNSPSIVTLVVDMRDEEGKIRETLQYWFQFINNHRSEGGAKPHLLIIGSHADEIPSSDVKQKSRVLKSIINSYKFDSVTLAGQIIIDCRYAESSSMKKLRSMLSEICHSLRSSEKMAAAHHSFMIFLLHTFGNKIAVTLRTAEEELKRCRQISDYKYLKFVESSDRLVEMCTKLSKCGNILFMKNKEHPENSWIVLDKAILLSQVNGVVFAPEGFKEHQKSLSTSTGVVPLSKLAPLFPNIDSDMITQFLCYLEFCQEIKELELASLLVAEGQSTPTAGEQYFFFPGLVHLDTPQDVIESSSSKLDYNSGWVLQCSKSEQFFSSRFLQVLLLRLAFLFALAPTDPSTADHLALHRKCSVWKNGIYWVNRSGGEAIVEVNNLRQVVVIVRSKLEKMELVRLRSAVIKTIMNAKEEFCSKVLVSESLILPEDATMYPLDPSKVTGVSITEVAATIAEGKEFAIDENKKTIELEELMHFEPYAYLGKPLLQKLLSKDNTETEEISDELLTEIATEHSQNSLDEYCVIFQQKIHTCTSREGINGLLQVFQLWRNKMGKEGTRNNFMKRLDQFSVFAGRNPLELIAGTCKCY